MERIDVDNTINQKIKDNTTREITPKKVRDSLGKMLDYADAGLSAKVDEVAGKGLSSNDYTDDEKTTLAAIENAVVEAPTYQTPTAGLTNVTQTVERGSDLTGLTLNISFSQKDGGAATSYELKRDGVQLSTTQNNSQSETDIVAQIVYQGFVSYSQGNCKNNNLGIQDCTGRITAGTASSPQRKITPKLKFFWGDVAAKPTTSANARALEDNAFEGNKTITLNTGASNKIFAVAVPSTYSITQVIDLDALNADITSSYVVDNGSFTVNDAGGHAQTYKLYIMQQAVPYSSNHRHQIKIS